MGCDSRRARRPRQVKLREATAQDALDIIPHLSEEDHAESVAVSGLPIRKSLSQAYAQSAECWAVDTEDDELIALGGVRPDGDDSPSAAIWFVCGPSAARAPKALVRLLRGRVRELGLKYGLIYGFVDARNTTRQRWIGALGFKVHSEEPINFGHLNLPFYQFISIGGQ